MRHFSPRLYPRKFAAFYLGCLGCYTLQLETGASAVLASASVGFAATLMPLPARWDRRGMQVAAYTGTFAGMGSRELLGSHLHVLLVSAIGAAVYLAVKPYFNGVGGRMGAIAFVASLLLLLARAVV